MTIYRERVAGREIIITVEPVFNADNATQLGFVARVSSPYSNDTSALIPYLGEFVRDTENHTVLFADKDISHIQAINYANRRLSQAQQETHAQSAHTLPNP